MKPFYTCLFTALVLFVFSCSKQKSPQPEPQPESIVLTIGGINPTTARPKTTVTITGKGYGVDINAVTVQFGTSAPVKPKTLTPTEITVDLPLNAVTGKITVTVGSRNIVSAVNFNVLPVEQDLAFVKTITLPTAKIITCSTVLGNKMFFATSDWDDLVTEISIYDVISGNWSTETVPVPRKFMAAAAIDGKVIFAGGLLMSTTAYSDATDIYDSKTNTWTHDNGLSQKRYAIGGAAAGNKIMFAGGSYGNSYSDVIDVYNTTTGKWESPMKLNVARSWIAGAANGNYIMFAGGFDGTFAGDYKYRDVYNLSTGVWTTLKSTTPMNMSVLTGAYTQNMIAFANNEMFMGHFIPNPESSLWGPMRPMFPFNVFTAAGDILVFAGEGKISTFNFTTYQWQEFKTNTNLRYLAGATTGNTIVLFGNSVGLTSKYATHADIITLVYK